MEVIKIKLSFSNAYLIKDRKSILVDAGSPNEANRIISAVQKAGVDVKDISLLIHTHGHFDHAGSTAALKRKLGVPSAVHKKDAFMLREGRNGEIKPHNFEAQIIKILVPKSFEPSEPDIIIEEEMSLSDFGVDGSVIFTPGHTQGSVAIVLGNKEAIIGDVLMGGIMGGALFGSRPNYHYYIDDVGQIHANIKKILGLKPAKLFVGHGGPLHPENVIERFSVMI